MVRHTDMQMIVMKKEVYAYRSLKRRGMPHGAMWGSMSVRGNGVREHGPEPLLGFSSEGMGEIG